MKAKHIFLSLAMGFCLLSFTGSAQTEKSKLEALTKEFLSGYFKASPITATQTGVHLYDSLIDDISPLAQEVEAKRLNSFKNRLKDIDPAKLSQNASIDYRMLVENIDERIFDLTELKEYGWNPMNYTTDIGNAIASLIYQEFAPVDVRMKDAASRLRRIPHYCEQARGILHNPPLMHTETAISQNEGNIRMIAIDMMAAAKETSPALQEEVKKASDSAIAALKDFGAWLEHDVKPTATRSARLGKALFEKKLRFALKSDLTPGELLKRTEKEESRVHGEMYRTALPLYKKYFHDNPAKHGKLDIIRKVLGKVVLEHPAKEALMDTVKSIIAGLQQFVTTANIVTLDSTQPLAIRETPEYERGISVASLESPGPLEKNMKSFYNVTPIPDDWTPEQVESYLREYNNWSLRDLSMHEGIPGHYVQLYYSNRNPSVVRSVFGSGPMIEGWAVYAERMTTDAGYMDNDPRMRLIMLKWYLRAVINAILDQKIHAGTMTERQAMALMMKDGFQEEREAAGKWKRANLTSTQLSTYFVGFQEIWDLREAYRKKMGDKFNLKEFNEMFLSFGSAPVKYIREVMLKK